EFEALPRDGGCELRHVVAMDTVGVGALKWFLVYGPLHEAFFEEILDNGAVHLGSKHRAVRWSWYARAMHPIAVLMGMNRDTPAGGSSPAHQGPSAPAGSGGARWPAARRPR